MDPHYTLSQKDRDALQQMLLEWAFFKSAMTWILCVSPLCLLGGCLVGRLLF